MKNLTLCIMTFSLLLSFTPTSVQASVVGNPISMAATPKTVSPEVIALRSRLDEIKKMDKSGMSAAEKKQLRKEARAVKSELRSVGGGVYVSAGALIVLLIVLLLIL
jgi:hypothetical protein